MHAFLLSFGIIFVAELGDKSQLMALTFAARYRALSVLIGITLATAVVHAVSVAVGVLVSVSLPTATINIIAGVAFFAFAAWTLRGDKLSDEESARSKRMTRSVIFAVAAAFFLAELGDKTMLATITLATTEGVVGTWLGSTTGMVVADALAIGIGKMLGSRLPERAVAVGASVIFIIFGILLVVEGLMA